MAMPFVWFDLTASKPDEVREFYGLLLGWTVAPEDNAGPYRGWILDGDQPRAAVVKTDGEPAGRWVPYVQVDDLDVAADKAVALGATFVQGKTEGPAGTAITVADPGGAHLALWIPRAS